MIVAGSFFVLVLLNFAWFWPIYTDGLLTHAEWTDRIWFARWIYTPLSDFPECHCPRAPLRGILPWFRGRVRKPPTGPIDFYIEMTGYGGTWS